MKGPSKKDIDTLGRRIERLERWSVASGVLVIFGLLMESGPELLAAIRTGAYPGHGPMGAAVITIGVLGEVVFSRFIARAANELQEFANSSVAEARATAAEAMKAAAESNLQAAHAKLELERLKKRQDPRFFNKYALLIALRDHPPGKAIIFFQPDDPEAQRVAENMSRGFDMAKWGVRQAEPIPDDLVCELFAGRSEEDIRRMSTASRAGGHSDGISIATQSRAEGSPGYLVHEALASQGLEHVAYAIVPSLPTDTVRIIVGPKPLWN